ncbi:MAG: M48 family metalloprotease [Parvibaculales bacterium]
MRPLLSLIVVFLLLAGNRAQAGGFIRDAEIEKLLLDYARPIFLAAGLKPDNIGIGLIDDRSINAFVTGGQNIYFHTGLILEAETPNMVIGVIAHETGHITGGHLARMNEALEESMKPAILATILGIGAIAAGQGDAGLAILSGGSQIAERNFLAYSRAQEAAADQVAVELLDSTQQSPEGIRDLMDHLADQEILSEVSQDPYVRSHPISRDRVNFYQNWLDNSPYAGTEDDPELVARHKLAQAKIYGFLDHPGNTKRRYANRTDTPALYALAIAFHKENRLDDAIALISELINRQEKNPYFHELRGQIFHEAGKPDRALPAYRTSLELEPEEPLLMVGLATALIATENRDNVQEAIQTLKVALHHDPENTTAFYQLALAYGYVGDQGNAELATAERYFLYGNKPLAAKHAARATKVLTKGSPAWIRARDIIAAAGGAGYKQNDRPKERRTRR